MNRLAKGVLRGVRSFGSRSSASSARSSVAVAHSSWFRIPEQNMKDFELLARGSAFLVRGPETGLGIALSSAHVAAPHRYRRYFPADWLSFVQDEHVRCALEIRSSSGAEVLHALPPAPLVECFRHATLDVAATIVSRPGEPLPDGFAAARLTDGKAGEAVGLNVSILGHEVEAGDEGQGIVQSLCVDGQISMVDGDSRGFVDTGVTDTVMGMCGGPVVQVGDEGLVVGLLEGLVPRLRRPEAAISDQHRKIAGQSVYVSASELNMFVSDVEKEWTKLQGTSRERNTPG